MADGAQGPVQDPYTEFGGGTIRTGISSQPQTGGSSDPYAEFGGGTVATAAPQDYLGYGTVNPPENITPGQVMTGFAKEVGKTALGAVNTGINVVSGGKPQLSPKTQQFLDRARQLTTTKGVGEGAGGIMEQGLEWYGGEKAVTKLAGLMKIVHSAPEVMDLLKNYPQESKIILDLLESKPAAMAGKAAKVAAKGATVGGIQGGIKGAADGDTIGGAESGAKGGAIGSIAAELGLSGIKGAGKMVGIGRDSLEEATRTAKPGKWNTDWEDDWKRALPRLANQFKEIKGKGVEGVADAALKDSNRLWQGEIKPMLKGHENDLLNTTPVADAVEKKISSAKTASVGSGKANANAMQEVADLFKKEPMMRIDEIEKEIEKLNADLTTEGWWKKSAPERNAEITSNSGVAAKAVAADALRDTLTGHINSFEGNNIDELKKTYGALRNVEHEFRGQVNVQGRQSMVSLKKVLGMTAAAGAGAAAHGPVGAAVGAAAAVAPSLVDSMVNSPDAMAERAVRLGRPEKAIVTGAKNAGKAAVRAGGGVTGEKASNWVHFKGSDGKDYIHHPDESWDDIQKADPGASK